MADEVTKLILGDTAISAIEQSPAARKRFFRRRKTEPPTLTHCENCGAPLSGHYCAQCGQAAINYRRSFRYIIVDLLNEFLNWDSKFFATIALLLVRPWKLTNDFLTGHRVRYVHPLRLYLLASIIFFFAINYWAKSFHLQSPTLPAAAQEEIKTELQKENLTPAQREKLERALNLTNVSPDIAAKTKELNPGTKSNRAFVQSGPESANTSLGKWFEERAREKIGEHGTNAQLFLRTLISNLPYMMLCCIPLFAFVLKLLYIRRNIFYIDHLIYALHIHSFAYLGIMLIVAATLGLGRVASGPLAGWIIGLLWLTFAVQIFLSIRRVYRQRWFFTVFKFFLGGLVYLLVLSVAFLTTLFITLALP
jgi:hypothetical protein